MRYIVFSFDDGLCDFKENALELFLRYGFCASINVITRYSELGFNDKFRYLSISDLKDLQNKGFELACHSDTHQSDIKIEDFDVALNKMRSYFGEEKYGCILPFSQTINEDEFNHLKDEFSYVADYPGGRLKNNFHYWLSYFLSRFLKSKKYGFYYRNYAYFYKSREKFYTFKRLPIKRETPVKTYIHFLKHMPNDSCLTFMFHSVTSNEEVCPWIDGSWNYQNLDRLLKYLSKNKRRFSVKTQGSLK